MKLNIPTAAEARHNVESIEREQIAKQAAEVEILINRAIASGARAAGGPGRLRPQVRSALEQLGYQYRQDSHRNEDSWSVTW